MKWVQRRLQLHGFATGAPDGVFGAKTDKEVRAFQRANGLEVDGVVGPATRQALKRKGKGQQPAAEPAGVE